jgi:hypothetical protein
VTLFPYPISCTHRNCSRTAEYKVAARWTDGVIEELKTYALCCAVCLPEAYASSRRKRSACRLSGSEKLDQPGIYRLEHGRRDAGLKRLTDIEQKLQAASDAK